MKSRLTYTLPALLVFLLVSCQQPGKMNIGPLTLSTSKPKIGEKVKVTYDTKESELSDTTKTYGTLYYFVKTNLYASDIALSDSGSVKRGSFILPDSAQSFGLKFSNDDKVDKNGGKGYVFPVYNPSGKPVAGARATASQFYRGIGQYFLKLKQNPDTSLSLLTDEFAKNPQMEKTWMNTYLYTLYSVKKDTAYPEIKKQITEMLSGKNVKEQDLMTARNLYMQMKMKPKADSIQKIILKKYPYGTFALNLQANAFSHLSNIDSMISRYHKIHQEFITKNHNKSAKSIESFMLSRIAAAYAKAGNYKKFNQYASKITRKMSVAGMYNQIAWKLAQKGEQLSFADTISKKSLDIVQEQIGHPGNDKPTYYSIRDWIKALHSNYGEYADTYALILAKKGKYAGALSYQKKAIKYTKSGSPEVNGRYAEYLIKTGHYKTAQKEIEKFMRESKSTKKMIGYLKTAYSKNNGSTKGFNEYLSSLESTANNKIRNKLKSEMIDKPAPNFELPDLHGNHVTLASMRGKIVVVDFWATWCGPCKSSFPGMEQAVDKFKNDPNVVFLFVDTWEHTKPSVRVKQVNDFITGKKYPFHVLLDQPQASDSSQFSIVTKYGVTGIPTKFIIDPNGHIRFKKVGYFGSSSHLVKEVSMMISMTKKNS